MAEILSLSRLATFKKGRKLSAAHKRKISAALKGRKHTSAKDRVLAIRESEAKARSARNIGYIANALTQGVREARLTARYFGFDPARRQSTSGVLRRSAIAARDLQAIKNLLR